MVQLTLAPLKGNHARRFPYQGHLGFSPVKLSGTVQTTVEEDGALLQASTIDVRVRCYEADWSNGGKALDFSKARAIYQVSQRLWSSTGDLTPPRLNQVSEDPNEQVYKPLGNFKSTWKLTIPVNAVNEGARSSATYTRWRIWWVLEAIVQHQPEKYYGSHLLRHYHLHLMSHAYPLPTRPLEWKSGPNEACLPFEYEVHGDTDAYSPGQRFALNLRLRRTSSDTKTNVKKVVVELRREILMTPLSPASTTDSEGPHTPEERTAFDQVEAHSNSSSSSHSGYFTKPISKSASNAFSSTPSLVSATPPSSSSRTPDQLREDNISVLTLSTSSVHFNSNTGSAEVSLSGFIPRRKTEHHWSLGETSTTQHLSVRFFVAIQIHVKSRTCPVIELPTRDVMMYGVSAEDRALAREELQRMVRLQQKLSSAEDMRRSVSCNDTLPPELGRRRSSGEDSEMEARLNQARKRFASTTSGFDIPQSTPAPLKNPQEPGYPSSHPQHYRHASSGSISQDHNFNGQSDTISFVKQLTHQPKNATVCTQAAGRQASQALGHHTSSQESSSPDSSKADENADKVQVFDEPCDFSRFSFASSTPSGDEAVATEGRSSRPLSSTSSTAPSLNIVQKIRAKSKERFFAAANHGDSAASVSTPESTSFSLGIKSTPFSLIRPRSSKKQT